VFVEFGVVAPVWAGPTDGPVAGRGTPVFGSWRRSGGAGDICGVAYTEGTSAVPRRIG
jgi:hypothetical protein